MSGYRDYTYDLNGNMISNGMDMDITYDPFTNLTKSVNTYNGTVTYYQYNGNKERILKHIDIEWGSDWVKTLYLRGRNEYPLVEKVKISYSANENERLNIYGPTGIIATIDNGNSYFFVKDHLGSIRAVLDRNNEPVSFYDYTPFGSKVANTTINMNSTYQFTGQEYDGESNLYNFRARLYDSNTGIFYSMDPAGQNHSPYSYCGNNPVIYTDANGQWFGIDDLIVSGISFITGYLNYGFNTGNFGLAAVKSGGIAAGSAWLAYNSGGAAAGLLFDEASAGYAIAASTVGGVVGGATGSIANQLAFSGKVNWNMVGNSTLSGLGGGLVGGMAGQYISMDPVGTGILAGAVSGGIDGLIYGNFLNGMMQGAWWGGFGSTLTYGAYETYGRYLTNKYLAEGAYGTDYEGIPIGLEKQLQGSDFYFDKSTYDCKSFAKDLFNLGFDGRPVGWKSGNLPAHVGFSLGRTNYGQFMILSKIGMSNPIRVTTANYLNKFYGPFSFVNGNFIKDYQFGFDQFRER